MKPKLCTKNSKDWFVSWRDDSGRLRKTRAGINKIKDIRLRKEYGRQLLSQINSLSIGITRPSCIDELRALADSKKSSLRRRSWQSYHYAINKLEAHLNGRKLTMEELTRSDCRQFVESLYKQNFNGHTINGIRGFLGTLFSSYADQHEGYVNPFKGTRKAQLESGRHVAFSDSQREKIWGQLSPELHLYTRFIYYTYLRPLELLRLRVGDIRTDMGEIIIKGNQSKNKKQQSVVIPDAFLYEIKLMGYDELPPDWFLFGQGLVPGPVSMGRNAVTIRHRKVLTDLGFSKDYTLYSWKHTGVVAAYRAGIDLYSIMRQLRHHSLEMTQIYLKSLGLVRNEQFGRLMV